MQNMQGFLVQYDAKDVIPRTGDIINVKKILIGCLPSRDIHLYFCKNINLIKRGMEFIADTKKLTNFSKRKSSKTHANTVYQSKTEEISEKNEDKNIKETFEDKGFTLISSLNSFANNANLYLNCKIKNPIKKFVTKNTKKRLYFTILYIL